MNTGPKTINPNKFHVYTVSILSDREPAPVIQTCSFSACL